MRTYALGQNIGSKLKWVLREVVFCRLIIQYEHFLFYFTYSMLDTSYNIDDSGKLIKFNLNVIYLLYIIHGNFVYLFFTSMILSLFVINAFPITNTFPFEITLLRAISRMNSVSPMDTLQI